MIEEKINYLTTLQEKEMLAQSFVGTTAFIKMIFNLMNSVIILDSEGTYIESTSQKFIRYCNQSLSVAKREKYPSIKVFMNEYQQQKQSDYSNQIEEKLPLEIVLKIQQRYFTQLLKRKYPEMEDFLVSGDQVAIFIPNEENYGKTIIQTGVDDVILQKIKK